MISNGAIIVNNGHTLFMNGGTIERGTGTPTPSTATDIPTPTPAPSPAATRIARARSQIIILEPEIVPLSGFEGYINKTLISQDDKLTEADLKEADEAYRDLRHSTDDTYYHLLNHNTRTLLLFPKAQEKKDLPLNDVLPLLIVEEKNSEDFLFNSDMAAAYEVGLSCLVAEPEIWLWPKSLSAVLLPVCFYDTANRELVDGMYLLEVAYIGEGALRYALYSDPQHVVDYMAHVTISTEDSPFQITLALWYIQNFT